MKLHIHIGPANHQKILLQQLRSKGIEYFWTNYFPHFEYGSFSGKSGSKIIHVPQKYDLAEKLVGWIGSRFPFFRNKNGQMDLTFPFYDKAACSTITGRTLLFAWPMVAFNTIRKVNDLEGTSILDYPIAHINSWQRTLEEEARIVGYDKAPRSLFTKPMENLMLREIEEAQLINVPSKFVWNSFVQNGVPEKKLVLNNYGVDAGRFYPSEQKDAMFTIVYVGSVELRKGVHYLVQAFDKLKLRNAQIKVIGHLKEDFVGSFPGYLKYEHVKWLGHCSPDQTAEVMRRSHVLVMPSVMEGQSLTILEGQACGLPVIASENTGGADIIKNGYNGYLFPNRDVEQLSQYILRLYKDTDLVRTMGLNASQVFAQNFTADLYGQRIINLLCRFLN